MRRPALHFTARAAARAAIMTAAVLAAGPLAATGAQTTSPLSTRAERSGYAETGRYAEVIELCAAFAAEYPDAVRCLRFGNTPEGRPMLALVVSRSGALEPEAAKSAGVPVVLAQGGIHAGEIDGKDAGFLAVRQMLEGKAAPGALERSVLVFVPVFNVDGHERFAAWNRPNQNGPTETGWRTTAQNYNLNRDYAKADAPEMQAMLALVETWDPVAMLDLHVTDGAKFEHDISITVEPIDSGDEALRAAGRELRDGTIARLREQRSLPLPFYPSFVEDDDPTSGFAHGVAPPRFSTGYFPLRNRLAMLVETHSWKDYPTRVRITRNTVVAVMEQVARHGRRWRAMTLEADAHARELAGKPVALSYAASDKARIIDFRGYAYTRTPSEISGALMTRYDDRMPQIWKLPLRDEIAPSLSVVAPKAGYLVPVAQAETVGAKLRQHGIVFERLQNPLAAVEVEAFRASKVVLAANSTESHQRATIEGGWTRETQDLAAGALFVPIAQPKARLVMSLLEPQAPDALAAWGWFNNAFERKEYMEAYVTEDVARDMLARDPTLREAFAKRLKEDEAFAKSPEARLEFFYRLHPSWDERFNLYPVLRTDQTPQ